MQEQAHSTILAVDDDEDTRELIKDLLLMAGYEPLLAATGRAGLDLLASAPVDLVLLDLRLPDIHGYELCRRMRESEAMEVPILMLTANEEREGAARGLRLGADDYLRKPFVPEELLERIALLLRRREANDALVTENNGLRGMLANVQNDLATAGQTSSAERTLRREFLHNVTVHFRALCGVIESEYRRAPLGPPREVAQRILGRVRGAALVYETSELLQDDPVSLETLVQAIANALKQIYSPRKRLPVTIEGEPVDLPPTHAAPIAMIVNELVTNCFKHAFPDLRFGAIAIRYGVADGELRLEVSDDGVGMAEQKAAAGRGRTTVEQLAGAMGGAATWTSAPNGTTASVRIPITA
jgi:DNA-binding response OmpR family regulator